PSVTHSLTTTFILSLLSSPPPHRHLHSFPTRRSSDLFSNAACAVSSTISRSVKCRRRSANCASLMSFGEMVTISPNDISEAQFADLRRHFTEREIVELTAQAAFENRSEERRVGKEWR